ncbi:uncharacterized protein LOC128227096 [Mya arenaria]|uniref:uncharacterized protein LOC128227096 n=1 Tax=Mya arenaria TaxID=6604 RepID=UPI0022E4D700|nr:uncharacterized protein LOC128227096 [Mya arenaria]
MLKLKIIFLFSWFLCYVCDFNSVDSAIYMPNAVKGGLSFRNCNSTPVPLTFEHVDIQPDPVQMDLGYINLSMNATLTKMIGNSSKVDASLSIRLKTEHGETELCYILGEKCYVSDVCHWVKSTLNVPTCTFPPFQGKLFHKRRHFTDLHSEGTIYNQSKRQRIRGASGMPRMDHVLE